MSKNYPVSIKSIIDRPDWVCEVFVKEYPHKGGVISVCQLIGSSTIDSPDEIYISLEIGEKLQLKPPEKSKSFNPILSVFREDGTYLGDIPQSNCTVPNLLMKKGIEVACYAEAKGYIGGCLALGVSLYCKKY